MESQLHESDTGVSLSKRSKKKSRRSVIIAFLVSTLLHGLAFPIAHFLAPEEFERAMYRVKLLRPPRPERKPFFPKKKGITIPRVGMEKLVVEGVPGGLPEFAEPTEAIPPRWETPEAELREGMPGEKPEFVLRKYELMPPREWRGFYKELPSLEQEGITLSGLDLGHISLIAVDPENKRNIAGYFCLPVNKKKVETIKGHGIYSAGLPREARIFLDYMTGKTNIQASYKGYLWDYQLGLGEMRDFPLLFLPHIKVSSIEALGEYLKEGGFAIMKGCWLFHQLRQYLEATVGNRAVEVSSVSDDDGLVSAFYNVDVSDLDPPIYGQCLRLKGRLVAVCGNLIFDPMNPKKSIKLRSYFTFNVVIYGLAQPGSIGRQYVMR